MTMKEHTESTHYVRNCVPADAISDLSDDLKNRTPHREPLRDAQPHRLPLA